MPSNQLQLHLEKSISGLMKDREAGYPSSLLHQLSGLYNPSDLNNVRSFTDLSARLSDMLGRMRANRAKSENLLERKAYLEKSLLQIQRKTLVPSLNREDGGENIEIPTLLQQIGQTKELKVIGQNVITSAESSVKLLDSVEELEASMSRLGVLSSSTSRGNIDNGASWLSARHMGFGGFSGGCFGHGAGLSNAMLPSGVRMQKRLLANYQVLYTVNGHMMNPAYCTVFDKSGCFLLTGADDYLVKIWDVENGVLVRTCRGHNAYITLIDVTPDNSLFASADTFGSIRVWRMRDGQCLKIFKHKHHCCVNWLKFDVATGALASVADDGRCIVWDVSRCLTENQVASLPFFRTINSDSLSQETDVEPYNIPLISLCEDDDETSPNGHAGNNGESGSVDDVVHEEAANEDNGENNIPTLRGMSSGGHRSLPGLFEWSREVVAEGISLPAQPGAPPLLATAMGEVNGGVEGSNVGAAGFVDPSKASLTLPHIPDVFQGATGKEVLKVTW